MNFRFLIGITILLGMFVYSPYTLAEIKPPVHVPTISELVNTYSKEYGISSDLVMDVMRCENRSMNPTLQSQIVKNGVQEQSFGLAQINLPSHPDISLSQATDPNFSIKYMVSQIAAGKGYQWTCYRILEG
jgi:hypothetical protein